MRVRTMETEVGVQAAVCGYRQGFGYTYMQEETMHCRQTLRWTMGFKVRETTETWNKGDLERQWMEDHRITEIAWCPESEGGR